MKKLSFFFISILLAILLAYWQLFSAPEFGNSKIRVFKITTGQSLDEIGGSLKQAGFVRSGKIFARLAQMKSLTEKIRHGRYQLRKSMNVSEILNTIAYPGSTELKITIPEGFSIREIDERLSEIGVISEGEFVEAAAGLEGYLFPDTYFIYSVAFEPKDLISKMQANFEKKMTLELKKALNQQKRTIAEIIIVASILEKEVKTEKDFPITAGILWKRLNAGWPLQTDATLLYSKSSTAITTKELQEDSPYNTRKYKGLPPTPIGNPGLTTIKAAIYPKSSPYWFYLTDKDGNVHYALSNEEHNANRRKYLGK